MGSCGGNQNSKIKIDESEPKVEEPTVEETSKPPYEATWMRITKTKNGYVVYNYPNLWDNEETESPMMIIIKDKQLIDISYSDEDMTYTFDYVEKCADGSYYFGIGNNYRFKWIDKEKHIAQWIIYSGNDIQTDYYYIDSLYNKYPIVDFEWSHKPPKDD